MHVFTDPTIKGSYNVNVLITGAASRLGRAIFKRVRGGKQKIRLLDTNPIKVVEPNEHICGDILNRDLLWNAMRDMDAVIHTGEFPGQLPDDPHQRDQLLLELGTRGAHELCKSAVDAGVKRVVFGSTLEMFSGYGDDRRINEATKPQPTIEMAQMSPYLGELATRVIAQNHYVSMTVLRLGRLVDEQEVLGQKPDLMWLDYRDAAHAFDVALDRDTSNEMRWENRWALYHICADIDNPKYLVNVARSMKFRPRHNFTEHWRRAGREGRA